MKDLMNFAVAKIRAKEATLIDSNGFLRLSQSRNTNEFIKLLAEYGYDSDEDFDVILSTELKETYDYVKEASKSGNFLFPFLLKYDLFNIGVYMKTEFSGKETATAPFKNCGNYPPETLVPALRDGKKGVIPDELLKCYQASKEIYLNTGDIGAAQIHLDKNGYEFILESIKNNGSDFIKKYFMTEADIKNLMFSLRLKRIKSEELIKTILIKGGFVSDEKIIKAFLSSVSELFDVFKTSLSSKTIDEAAEAFLEEQPLSDINGILDENLKNLLDKTRLTPFGIDPIMAYVLNKEAEIMRLRLMYYKILAQNQ